MSAGPSLYRRHRPRSFDDVVGQEHIVRTLRNAVEQDRVHHAYLFVGSRGTGKTSMAKILAACLNCEKGRTTEPCGVCGSCTAIASASSMDVIEMDAASNNSVDDIRELREDVHLAPLTGRHKVYILDEAHMLTPAAWNAFLKTLEEPPPRTVFVLATTEAHKVMDTVTDRCHRFDFGRPTTEQLASVVQRVAVKEGIEIGADAVALLARHAAGSFRDALGTLEQLVAYAGTQVATGDVLGVLGVADDDLLFGALDAIGSRDAAAAWRAAAQLAESGRDPARFLRDLEAHARDLLVVQTLGEVPTQLAMTAERDERLLAQARRLHAGDVVRVLDLIGAALRLSKDGADAYTQLELVLVRAAAPDNDPTSRALLARIERVEQLLAGGEAPVAVPAAPAPAPQPAAAPAPVSPVAPAPAGAPAAAAPPATAPPVAPASAPAARAQPAPAPAAVPPSLDLLADLWPAVLQSVGEVKQPLAVALADSQPVAASGLDVTVALPGEQSFQRKLADQPPSRQVLHEAIRAVTGASARVTFELRDMEPATQAPMSEDELLERFMEEFDAQEIDPAQDDQEGA